MELTYYKLSDARQVARHHNSVNVVTTRRFSSKLAVLSDRMSRDNWQYGLSPTRPRIRSLHPTDFQMGRAFPDASLLPANWR